MVSPVRKRGQGRLGGLEVWQRRLDHLGLSPQDSVAADLGKAGVYTSDNEEDTVYGA